MDCASRIVCRDCSPKRILCSRGLTPSGSDRSGATLLFGILGLAAWGWPRSPKHRLARHETVWIEVSNEFPVFDLADGTKEIGDH